MSYLNPGIILYANGNSQNHGCEALVRSSCQIARKASPDLRVTLLTDSVAVDKEYLKECCQYSKITSQRSWDFYRALLRYKLSGDWLALDTYPYKSVLRSLNGPSIALSVGGDNYCYGNTAFYARLNSMFRKSGHKTVLWGCSISEDALNSDGTTDDLKSYSLITARESLTFELLKSRGLVNVELYPDPAFTLKIDSSALPSHLREGRTVGINISPMIQDNEAVPGCTLRNYRHLIDTILQDTDYDIALIPHVVWKQSDDRIPLKELYDEFSSTGRVIMVEDANAEQLKGVISKCRFMVAARTHASIAAYSTCVPTLVVGYSVKARGIAKDIFGSYEDYVLPVQDLRNDDDLANKFRWIMEHETEIKNHLSSFMPGYIARAWKAGEALKNI